ncbi:MAG: ABC transporter permease [Chloroflexota bacterium]|nr:ABC transporter permease [Chloroflexota bacterium]
MVTNGKTVDTGKARAFARWITQRRLTITFLLLGLVIVLFIFIPLAKMIFSTSPGVLWDTLLEGEVRSAIWLSLYTALIATAVGLVFGVPLAYFLARHSFPGKRLVEGLIDVPIVVPHIAAGIALLFVFGKNFTAGKAFDAIGIDFVMATPGIVIAMIFVSVPFLINSAKQGFEEVDVRLEKVARTLGASPWQAFFSVSLPLARRGIFGGAVMMWARSISEFGAVLVLCSHPTIAPILVYDRLEAYGLDYALPVATLLIIICLIIFVALRTMAYRGKRS